MVAAAILLWRKFPVTAVSLDGPNVVLNMSDSYGRQMLPDDPYFNKVANSPDVFVHDAYLAVPIYAIAIAFVVLAGCFVAVFVRLRRLRGHPT